MTLGVITRRAFTGLVFFCLFMGLASSSFSESSKEKLTDIKKLLIVSGIHEQMSYMKQNIINSYGKAVSMTYPKIPSPFWDEFNDLIQPKEVDELINRVILVYDKHMSHEVIKELIKMFDTDFWREWKEKMPKISREAGAVGSQWGQELTQTEAFSNKIDHLIEKYELKKLNQNSEPKNNKPQ
ncbi:MAG: DUF2059 domain-containing protein [Nitrospinales bacterium]